MDYKEFLETKRINSVGVGFTPSNLNKNLWLHQPAIVEWACKKGRAAIFADTGLGKTIMQLEWASQVSRHTNKPVLILAPLAVGKQTEMEAKKFNILSSAKYMREPDQVHRIVITNYEMLNNFNPELYGGIVLDESSILKSQSGAYRKLITEFAKNINYRLSCTATPSPNDFMELGNQCEFLGVMSQVEMLSMYFTHDGSETQKWRLKGHAKDAFWKWLASWSVVVSNPSDLGFDGDKYKLPNLAIDTEVIQSVSKNSLFADVAQGLNEVREVKRDSMIERCEACAEWVNSLDEPVLIWAETNAESELLTSLIDDAVEVAGGHKQDVKEDRLLGFASGKYKKLVSKARIAGFGMNYQHSCKMAFVAPTYSFEQFYQSVRRQWRFGQKNDVHVKVFMTESLEGVHNIMLSKLENDKIMRSEMIKVMSESMNQNVKGAFVDKTEYNPQKTGSKPSFI